MNEKEIMTIKQVSEYLQININLSPMILFLLSKSLASGSLINITDKWMSEQSLERLKQNIKASPKKKVGINNLWVMKRNIQMQL